MEAWALFIHLNCSEPRLQFKPFYQRVMGHEYPAPQGVQMDTVHALVLEGFARYADYIAAYAEECRFKQERK
jgi:hypothetical protein